MREPWVIDGRELTFQDGDYVRIDTIGLSSRVYDLRFLEGFVRGFEAHTQDGKTTFTYSLFKMGDNPLDGVKEEILKKASSPFGRSHEGNAHDRDPRFPHNSCGLCGWERIR